MGAISGVDLRLAGSHAGVEIGADGPSQMGLEDLAMMRAVHGSTVLYPADGTSTAALVEAMAVTAGISYIRTTRGSYSGLYPAGEAFPVGGSKVLRTSEHDEVTLIGAGVTLHECLRAADILDAEDIGARVIDCYCVKPIDTATIAVAAQATGGRIVIAEDHHPKAGSARRSPMPCSPPGSATCSSRTSRSARCQAPGPARSCSRGPASTQATSPPPPAGWPPANDVTDGVTRQGSRGTGAVARSADSG